MISVVLQAPGRLVLRERDDPEPPAYGQVLVRVLRVGICGTDLHAYLGEQPLMTYPVVLGHELAAEVSALGPGCEGSGLEVGDRCTVVPYLGDGECDACRRGFTNCCEHLEVLGVHRDGGMRERMLVPASTLIPANDLRPEALALAEMLAVGAHAVRRAGLAQDDTVLVIGGGPIGLSVLSFARIRAATLAVAEVSAPRLAFLQRVQLADAVIDMRSEPGDPERPRSGTAPARHPAETAVRTRFGGRLPTVVIDATGNARSMEDALRLVGNGGRLVLVGHTKGTLSFDNPALHTREAAILGSRNATREDFDEVLRALRSGQVDPTPWITHTASPEALVRNLSGWTTPDSGVVKAMLDLEAHALGWTQPP